MVRISLLGQHQMFVKSSLGPWLILSGAVLVIASAYRILTSVSSDDDAAGHAHIDDGKIKTSSGEESGHPSSWMALLLLLPVTALFAVKPGSLGSFAAERTRFSVDGAVKIDLAPLKIDSRGSASVMLIDVWMHKLYDQSASLTTTPLRMIGFVVPDATSTVDHQTFLLTRFKINCCAADGIAIQVRVTGTTTGIPPTDSWIELTGTFSPSSEQIPDVKLIELRSIPEPKNPYE